jgi:hypothetical protein
VRARPPESGSDVWLPAQSLTLSAEGADADSSVHVGEPLTLTLRLKAQGLGFEQLPELKLPKIDGADIYPDKETTQNRDDGSWQYGTRERKFAIVPSRSGTLRNSADQHRLVGHRTRPRGNQRSPGAEHPGRDRAG